MAKYLKLGTMKRWTDDNGESTYLELDNANMKSIVEKFNQHGAANLKGLSKEEVWAAEKAKTIRSIRAYKFDPKDGAPDFVLGDLCIKMD